MDPKALPLGAGRVVAVRAPAPPNDPRDNQTTSDETASNEKVMTNYGRRLLWRGVFDGVEPVIHASRQVKDRSPLLAGRLLLHHPKT
jgi:hypothetical protein